MTKIEVYLSVQRFGGTSFWEHRYSNNYIKLFENKKLKRQNLREPQFLSIYLYILQETVDVRVKIG